MPVLPSIRRTPPILFLLVAVVSQRIIGQNKPSKKVPQKEENRPLTHEEVEKMTRKEAITRILNLVNEVERNHRIDEGRITEQDLNDPGLYNRLVEREVTEQNEFPVDRGWTYRRVFVPVSPWKKPIHACYLDKLSDFSLKSSRGTKQE